MSKKILLGVARCEMFYYNFTTFCGTNWAGTIFSTIKLARENKLDIMRKMRFSLPSIENGGWHFSYFGNPKDIINKLESFSHQEYNHPKIGLTVMDGPFCSIMPKGNTPNQFLLYHAKYSILTETEGMSLTPLKDIEHNLEMITKDSSNYFPFIKDVKFIDYWRTTRAIPITKNDERLSKIITYPTNNKFITIFSGKISTCVKIAKQIKHGLLSGDFNNNINI